LLAVSGHLSSLQVVLSASVVSLVVFSSSVGFCSFCDVCWSLGWGCFSSLCVVYVVVLCIISFVLSSMVFVVWVVVRVFRLCVGWSFGYQESVGRL